MNNSNYHIAVLLTCHNRREKTIKSLNSLFESFETYNNNSNVTTIIYKTFITDDGCTDKTTEHILNDFKDKDIKIIKGNGSLFWAGGMRLAWETALRDNQEWDFFLLINDDTIIGPEAIIELLKTDTYAKEHYNGMSGVYSGIVGSIQNPDEITYGGRVYSSRYIGKATIIKPSGKPQECQLTNANILLVSKEVQKKIGILASCYQHSCADWAYGIEAHNAGFPVLVTSKTCGLCDNDHGSEREIKEKLNHMTIKDRYKYFSYPTHSTKDILTFMWHYNKIKFLLVILARTINILSPTLYYRLDKKR